LPVCGDDEGEMTTAADDHAVEEAFEACLAGRAVPAEGAYLAAFAGAVRASAIQPGRPHAALAELLATGLLVDQPLPSVRAAKRRRRPMWFFSALIAKIASAGAVAQAATGAGIVLVGFTGIGAAGALPAPVQHTFATVVSSITPLEVSDPTTTGSTDATTTTGTTTTDTTTSTTTDGTDAMTPAAPATTAANDFGKRVSEDAKDGGVDGQQVSSWAHERNAARKHGGDATTQATTAPETETKDASETEDASESTDGSDDSGTGDQSPVVGTSVTGGHGHH
jgi:hypothetical protein